MSSRKSSKLELSDLSIAYVWVLRCCGNRNWAIIDARIFCFIINAVRMVGGLCVFIHHTDEFVNVAEPWKSCQQSDGNAYVNLWTHAKRICRLDHVQRDLEVKIRLAGMERCDTCFPWSNTWLALEPCRQKRALTNTAATLQTVSLSSEVASRTRLQVSATDPVDWLGQRLPRRRKKQDGSS